MVIQPERVRLRVNQGCCEVRWGHWRTSDIFCWLNLLSSKVRLMLECRFEKFLRIIILVPKKETHLRHMYRLFPLCSNWAAASCDFIIFMKFTLPSGWVPREPSGSIEVRGRYLEVRSGNVYSSCSYSVCSSIHPPGADTRSDINRDFKYGSPSVRLSSPKAFGDYRSQRKGVWIVMYPFSIRPPHSEWLLSSYNEIASV
jgi:hypothetical protein